MNAPERLLDDVTIGDGLKMDLCRARDTLEGGYDVEAGADLFRETLKREIGADPNTRLTAPLVGKPALIGFLILGFSSAGLYYLFDSPSEVATTPPLTQLRSEPSTEQATSPNPTVVRTEAPSSAPLPEPASRPAPRSSVPSGTASVKASPTLMDEVEQLKRVRLALKSDAEDALRLAKEGHRTFPGGLLHEEREGLLILSLQKLKRVEEASKRAVIFQSRYPKSALLPQIASSLNRASP